MAPERITAQSKCEFLSPLASFSSPLYSLERATVPRSGDRLCSGIRPQIEKLLKVGIERILSPEIYTVSFQRNPSP